MSVPATTSPPKPETPVEPPTAAPKPNRVVVIDGLRLLAALMVVAFHFIAYDRYSNKAWDAPSDQVWPHLWQPASYGFLGVQMFFVISGFVICMSAWGRTLAGFFRSRISRLYPAYWAAALFTFTVLSIWPTMRQPVEISELLLNLTMLHEPMGVDSVDAVYWTLWAEARFYLLFAILVWRGLTVQRVVLFGYAWLVAGVFAINADITLLTTLLQPSYAPYFVAGIAFYLIYRFGSHPLTWGLVAVSLLMAQYHTVIMIHHYADDVLQRPLPLAPGLAIIGAVYLVMAAVATHRFDRIQYRWLTVAGVLTYPLYLIHEYVGWTFINAVHPYLPKLVTLLSAVTLMLLIAWLIHRFVERPVGKLLNRSMRRPLPAADPKPTPPTTTASDVPIESRREG